MKYHYMGYNYAIFKTHSKYYLDYRAVHIRRNKSCESFVTFRKEAMHKQNNKNILPLKDCPVPGFRAGANQACPPI